MFRKIKVDEIDLLRNLIVELADHEGRPEAVSITPQQLYQGIFQDQLLQGVFVENEKGIVGYALFFYSFSSFKGDKILNIEDYYLQKDQRGQGLGKDLLIYLCQEALNNQCTLVQWGCLYTNQSGLDYYYHLGAKDDNSHQHLYFDQESMVYLTRKKAGLL